MLIDHSQKKLLNAIAFFVVNTKYCGKTKLYKLLYFLDFEHYSVTGRSVTGLNYFAWPKGPVPIDIHEAIDDENDLLKGYFRVSTREAVNGHQITELAPLFTFEEDNFSRREKKLLNKLSSQYQNSYAEDMVEATHLENQPWDKIYNQLNLRQNLIPYNLALKSSEKSEMAKVITDNEEFGENYR